MHFYAKADNAQCIVRPSNDDDNGLGVIYKPRGHGRGRGLVKRPFYYISLIGKTVH